MCGIIGYTGAMPAKNILIDGLSKLEYRGYDSAGIALLNDNNQIDVYKKAGKVSVLGDLLKDKDSDSTCGIGHTRWATHGGVNDVNAHPHKVGNVALIHNGIIENYYDLITKYNLSDKLVSETDTEVVAALLDTIYDGDPIATLARLVKELVGSFALCIMFADKPGNIYTVRNVSPMVAASLNDGAIIASDITALIAFTKEYFIVPEYTILTLSKDGISMVDLDMNEVKPEILTVTWDIEAAQKGGFPHFMLKEIYEQPEAIERTITPRIKDGMPDFTEDHIPDEIFKGISRIFVVACGTALHAGMVFKSMVEGQIKMPVTTDVASEFRYNDPIIDSSCLAIFISQSGETIDTLEALRIAKKKGAKTLSVVNVKGSTIARESDYVLYTHAGPEIAVASTKAYTVQLAALYLIGARVGIVNNRMTNGAAATFIESLTKVPDDVRRVLAYNETIKDLAINLKDNQDAFFLGRGLDYTLSLEGALKLKEISYIHAEAYAAGELKHGTIALITEGVPVIALATQSHVYSKVISNIREVKARGAYVILLSKDSEVNDITICDKHISLPDVPDVFCVFLSAVILQFIAYYTSDAKGLDVDKPRNLAKSVTVE